MRIGVQCEGVSSSTSNGKESNRESDTEEKELLRVIARGSSIMTETSIGTDTT